LLSIFFKLYAMKTLLFILISFAGTTAFICGLMMVGSPSGTSLDLSLEILKGSFFKNFLIPGLFLSAVGLVNLIAVFYNIKRHAQRYNWAIAGGVLIIGWIVVQKILIQDSSILQYLYLCIGVLILLVAYQLKGKWAV
jgi:hypothetical protein